MSDLMFTPGAHNLIKPVPVGGPVKTWSFSSLTKFEQCPYAVYLGKIEGFKEPAGPAADRGSRIHSELEDYVQGVTGKFPSDVHKNLRDYADAMRAEFDEGQIEIEQEWTFDKEWNICEPKTPAVWAIFKCDVVKHESDTSIRIIDWKSGKIFGNELKHGTQGMFYAIAALLRYASVEYVQVDFAYVDHGQVVTRSTMTRNELPHFLPRLTKRALQMTQAAHFPPNPSKHNCRWCRYRTDVLRDNGEPACTWGISE